MQDAENVAAPEAAEERAESTRQQPAGQPPPEEESAGPGAPETARSEEAEEEAAAGPEPEVSAEPTEEAISGLAASPPPPPTEELVPQSESVSPGEQPREQCAEEAAGPEGSAAEAAQRPVENGEADEPSFSDPEDFVDDVSEEGKRCENGREVEEPLSAVGVLAWGGAASTRVQFSSLQRGVLERSLGASDLQHIRTFGEG